jgi:hypothetical protein
LPQAAVINASSAPAKRMTHNATNRYIRFTEPNIALVLLGIKPRKCVLTVELDHEFHLNPAQYGDPYRFDLERTADQLIAAARDWRRA